MNVRRQLRKSPATLDEVAALCERFTRYVESLEKQVARLTDRIVPYDPTYNEYSEMIGALGGSTTLPKLKNPTLAQIHGAVRNIDDKIENVEGLLRYIASVLDQARDSTYLSTDLREWQKPNNR